MFFMYSIRSVLSIFTLVIKSNLQDKLHSSVLPLPVSTSVPPSVKSDRASSFFFDVPPSEKKTVI